jgi:hypothetical protein
MKSNHDLKSDGPSALRVLIKGQRYETVAALEKGGQEIALRVVDLPSINLKQLGGLVMVERSQPLQLRVRPDTREIRAAAAGEKTELMLVTLVLAAVPDGE